MLKFVSAVTRLLAAVALQKIHWVDGYCVAADRLLVVFHDCLPEIKVKIQNLCAGRLRSHA